MKKKNYGGALGRHIKQNEMCKKMALLGLFLFGFILFGSLFDDAVSGFCYALAPLVIPSGVTDPVEIKRLTDAWNAEKALEDAAGGEQALAIKRMVEGFNAKQVELKSLIDAKGDATAIKAMEDAVAKMQGELIKQIGTLNEVISKQGIELRLMKENAVTMQGKGKTMHEALVDGFEKAKDEIDFVIKNNGKHRDGAIIIKAAVTIGVDTTIAAGSTQNTITQNTGIISIQRSRELTYRSHVSVGSIGTNRAVWIEETDPQGTPIFIGEGDSKTQLSILYVEKTEAVKKIAVYGKVTTELMSDIPQLISYIEGNLMRRLDIVAEDRLLFATGAGDDPKGMENYATQFTGGSLAGTVTTPNLLDVIEAIALQVKEGYGMPEALFVHPSTVAAMKLIKDDNGNPVWKNYVTIDGGMRISGLNIVESMAMTAGEFLGGDTKVTQLLIREELGIQIGLDGNDFIQNKKTMLLEKRLVQFVSANDQQVLVKGDFTTAIGLLTAV